MAIKIRPVRGQIEAPTLRGGRNLLRGTEFRGRQFAQAGQIASDFLGNIIKHEQDLENQRINNKVTNSEIYFLGQAEEQLQKLKEQNTVYSQEETDKIISDFGNFLDKEFGNYYKNDPIAAKKGLYYKEKAKLSFMSEVTKLRGNQILGESIANADNVLNKSLKEMNNNFKNSQDDPDIYNKFNIIKQENQKAFNIAISSGANAQATQEKMQILNNGLYNSVLLVTDNNGQIDIEASRNRIKKGYIGDPNKEDNKIPLLQKQRLNKILDQELQDRNTVNIARERQANFRGATELNNLYAGGKLTHGDIERVSKTLQGDRVSDFIQSYTNLLEIKRTGEEPTTNIDYFTQVRNLLEERKIPDIKSPFLLPNEEGQNLKPLSIVQRSALPATDSRRIDNAKFDLLINREKELLNPEEKELKRQIDLFFESNAKKREGLFTSFGGIKDEFRVLTEIDLRNKIKELRKTLPDSVIFSTTDERGIYKFYENNTRLYEKSLNEQINSTNEYINKLEKTKNPVQKLENESFQDYDIRVPMRGN